MKRNISVIALLMFSVSVFAVAAGCGKKGPPLPPEEEKSITAPAPSGETTGEPPAQPSAPAPSGEEPKKEPAQEPVTPPPSSPY